MPDVARAIVRVVREWVAAHPRDYAPSPLNRLPLPPAYGVRKTVPACQSVGVATMVVVRAGWSVASSDGFADAAIRSNASTSRTDVLRK